MEQGQMWNFIFAGQKGLFIFWKKLYAQLPIAIIKLEKWIKSVKNTMLQFLSNSSEAIASTSSLNPLLVLLIFSYKFTSLICNPEKKNVIWHTK